METSSEYLIDQILPSQEVSLLAGPSGAGKSRWCFDWLLRWEQGLSVHGFQSYPVPWAYASGDRSRKSVDRTLATMGLKGRFPIIDALDRNMTLNGIIDEAMNMGAKLIVIEAFGSYPDQPTPQCVKKYLTDCVRLCHRYGITILGIVESPKLKPNERYENPRQRVSGCASWAHFSETIMLVEPMNPKIPQDPYRIVSICPRNGAGMTIDMAFDKGGHLVPSKLSLSAKVAL